MKKEADKIKKEQEMRMNYIKKENKEHNKEYHQSPSKRRPKTVDKKENNENTNDNEKKECTDDTKVEKNATSDDINALILKDNNNVNKSPKKSNIIDNLYHKYQETQEKIDKMRED